MKAAEGTRVMAFSNLFGVAVGDEPVSVQRGTISVITRLEARRGVFETPYRGPVYVLDVTTNNPGAAGGALVTRRGELIGMLGKELRNSLNNTWLNYAVPDRRASPLGRRDSGGQIRCPARSRGGKETAAVARSGVVGHRVGARRVGADAAVRRSRAARLARRRRPAFAPTI